MYVGSYSDLIMGSRALTKIIVTGSQLFTESFGAVISL